MHSKDHLQSVIEKIYAARDGGDIDTMMGLLSDDCSFRMVGNETLKELASEVNVSGGLRQAMTNLVTHWDFSRMGTVGIHVDLDDQIVFGHRRGHIRHIPSGIEFYTEFVDKFEFRDGKPFKCVEFCDTLQLAEVSQIVKFA